MTNTITKITFDWNDYIVWWWWSDIVYVTQAEYTALLPWAASDGKHYVIYSKDQRQPWANTLAYYPLDTINTINDLSWNNHTLSNRWNVTFWIYDWVDCANFAASNPAWLYNSSDNIITDNMQYTYLAWINPDTTNSWSDWPRLFCSLSWNTAYGWLFIWWMRQHNEAAAPWWVTDWPSLTSGWQLICIVWDLSDGSYDWYKNGSFVISDTWFTWARNWILIWAHETNTSNVVDRYVWYMSKVIFENRQWTAQEILNYYNNTKWYYWIS